MAAIERDLQREGYIFRYVDPDDFGTPDNAFLVCTFWYVNALAALGRRDEARAIFERLLTLLTSSDERRLGTTLKLVNIGLVPLVLLRWRIDAAWWRLLHGSRAALPAAIHNAPESGRKNSAINGAGRKASMATSWVNSPQCGWMSIGFTEFTKGLRKSLPNIAVRSLSRLPKASASDSSPPGPTHMMKRPLER